MSKRKGPTQRIQVSDGAGFSSEQDVTCLKKKRKGAMVNFGEPGQVHRSLCYTDVLPEELLMWIFKFLEVEDKRAAALVCQRWRKLLNHPSFWRDMHAQLHLNRLKNAAFDSLQTRDIRQVTLLDRCNVKKLQQLCSRLLNVKSLSIEKCLLSNKQLESIFSKSTLSHLKCLCLRCKSLNIQSITSVLERLDAVEHLKLLAFDPRKFFPIMSALKKVQHLTVTFESTRLRGAPLVSESMPCMTELVLKRVKVDDSVLLLLKRAFPNLEKLDVGLHRSVSRGGIQHLAQMQQLRRLHLHSWDCPAYLMNCLKDGLTELQVLEIDAFSLHVNSVMTLAEFPSLKELSVWTYPLKWREYKRLLEGCKDLTRFALVLSELQCESNPPPRPLCCLPHMEEICLEVGSGLQDSHIQTLCLALPSLTKLVLKSTFSLTNASLASVAQVPTLRSLVVSRNHLAIDGIGLEHLKMGCAPLQDLSLQHLSKVKDPDIKMLQGLDSLHRLQVFGCHVTDKALIDCVMGLPHLQVLEADMSQESKQQLRRMRPGLTVRVLITCP